MTIKRVERKLRTAIERKLEQGFAVEPGSYTYSDGAGCCCALGSIVRDGGKQNDVEVIADSLGVSRAVALAINDGFEGFNFGRSESAKLLPFKALGEELRRDYYVSR